MAEANTFQSLSSSCTSSTRMQSWLCLSSCSRTTVASVRPRYLMTFTSIYTIHSSPACLLWLLVSSIGTYYPSWTKRFFWKMLLKEMGHLNLTLSWPSCITLGSAESISIRRISSGWRLKPSLIPQSSSLSVSSHFSSKEGRFLTIRLDRRLIIGQPQ